MDAQARDGGVRARGEDAAQPLGESGPRAYDHCRCIGARADFLASGRYGLRLPYIGTEMLGGERGSDWYGVRDLSTLLGGHVYSVGETPYAGTIDTWMQYSTELDFYVPHISVLATPLTHELRDYFMEDGAQTLSIDGFDEAYYAEFIKPNTRLPNEPDEVHQFLILRRGGEVLYFRTEAPDSLREHLDEFADIFNQYSELA